MQELGRAALASEEVAAILDSWTRRTAAVQRAAILGQKLAQLTMPGVPDAHQGNESVDLSWSIPTTAARWTMPRTRRGSSG